MLLARAPTAAYAVSSGVIQEFVVILVDQWKLHVVLLALPDLGFGTLLVLAIVSA